MRICGSSGATPGMKVVIPGLNAAAPGAGVGHPRGWTGLPPQRANSGRAGDPGVEWCKCFRILVEGDGRGAVQGGTIAEHRNMRKDLDVTGQSGPGGRGVEGQQNSRIRTGATAGKLRHPIC